MQRKKTVDRTCGNMRRQYLQERHHRNLRYNIPYMQALFCRMTKAPSPARETPFSAAINPTSLCISFRCKLP